MEITKEILEKAKKCTSTKELLELAKQNGIEMSKEQAAELFERFNKVGAIDDEELENVAGGGCDSVKTKCPKCKSRNIKIVYRNSAYVLYIIYECNNCGHKWKENVYW